MRSPRLLATSSPVPRPEAAERLAYVGLGGNLGDRLVTLQSAVRRLQDGALPGTTLLRCSPVFETRPLGPATHNFLNAVVELRTRLSPLELLDGLLAIEAQHGRTRRERWSSRTLDLDLLALTVDGRSQRISSPRLRLPHVELERRDFVLTPLLTLCPDLRPSGAASVRELLAAIPEGQRTIVAQVSGSLC